MSVADPPTEESPEQELIRLQTELKTVRADKDVDSEQDLFYDLISRRSSYLDSVVRPPYLRSSPTSYECLLTRDRLSAQESRCHE
jgi:hypothetical protein